MPYAGFSGPIPSVNLTMIAYPGSFHFRAGKRSAQRYTYSPNFPVSQFQHSRLARSLAETSGTLARLGISCKVPTPSRHRVLRLIPRKWAFLIRLASRSGSNLPSTRLSLRRYGVTSLDIRFPKDTEEICETPGGAAVFAGNTEPIELTPEDRTKANDVYDHWGQSISFFEASPNVSPFSSKVRCLPGE